MTAREVAFSATNPVSGIGIRNSLTGVLWADFNHMHLSAGFPHAGRRLIDTPRRLDAASLIPEEMNVDRSVQDRSPQHPDARDVLATSASTVVLVEHVERGILVSACAESAEAVKAVLDHVESRIPKSRKSINTLDIAVWYDGRNGSDSFTNNIQVPRWHDIARNYPAAVATPLAALMGMKRPRNRGRLILWHGEPGTGKTTAVRALIRSWQRWCTTNYVADPERLFASTEYLLEVVGRTDTGPTGRKPEPWRLIVAEDSDEFLRVSARREAGAALGRLLNLSDGILGQGTNTLLLLTTNERLDKLHPALIRPGRCLAQIEFTTFTPAEADAWLPSGLPRPSAPISLAELINLRDGADRIATGIEPAPNIGNYL